MRPKPPRGRSPKADAEVDNDVLPTARTAAATTIMVLRIPNLLCGHVLHPSRFPRSYLDAVRVHRSIGRAYQGISFGKASLSHPDSSGQEPRASGVRLRHQ